MRIAFGIILLLVGGFLEIYYYFFRFVQDGVIWWVSIIIGLGLTILLTVSAYYKDKWKHYSLIIILFVGVYSVIATSSGQLFSLMTKENETIQTISKDDLSREKINEYQIEIKRLNKKYDKLQDVIDNTVTSLEDRGVWRSTLNVAENNQKEIESNITELRKKINLLRDSLKTSTTIQVKETNIYKLYAELFNFSERWIQFILQTILSVFIALMSPIAVIILKDSKTKHIVKREKKDNWIEHIKLWCDISFTGIRRKVSETLCTEEMFFKFIDKKNKSFSKYKYNRIIRAGLRANVIMRKEGRIYPVIDSEVEAIKMIQKELNK